MKLSPNFKEDPKDGVFRDRDTLDVVFPIVIERHNKDNFQKRDERFVPRMIDKHGRARDWQGNDVYVGYLYHEATDVFGRVTDRVAMLRILADSIETLADLMKQQIPQDYHALFLATHVQASKEDSMKQLVDEKTILKAEIEQLREKVSQLEAAQAGQLEAAKGTNGTAE